MKGVIGVGMPIIALPMLSMFIDVRESVMLLSVPLVLSNIPQALEGGEVLSCLTALLPVLAGMVPGIVIGVAVLLTIDSGTAKLIAGTVVIIIGALTLLAPKLEINGRAPGTGRFCVGLPGRRARWLGGHARATRFCLPSGEGPTGPQLYQRSLDVPCFVRRVRAELVRKSLFA